MVLGKADAKRVSLVAGKMLMQQDSNMNLFTITEHQLVNTSLPRKGVSMEIKFKRKIMSEMMTTYLPSLLLMMITFATYLLKAGNRVTNLPPNSSLRTQTVQNIVILS